MEKKEQFQEEYQELRDQLSADAYIVHRGSGVDLVGQYRDKSDLGGVGGRFAGAKPGVLGRRWNLGEGLRAE